MGAKSTPSSWKLAYRIENLEEMLTTQSQDLMDWQIRIKQFTSIALRNDNQEFSSAVNFLNRRDAVIKFSNGLQNWSNIVQLIPSNSAGQTPLRIG